MIKKINLLNYLQLTKLYSIHVNKKQTQSLSNIIINQQQFFQSYHNNFSTLKIKNDSSKTIQKNNLAIKIIKQIESHIESSTFKNKFNSYHYLQKYSWICLHTWMIINRLRKIQGFLTQFKAFKLSYDIRSLLQEYTRDQVYEYNDYFDRQIYEELKRIQQSMFWSLDEHFYFDLKVKPIQQIIQEDLNLFVQENQEVQQKSREEKIKQMSEIGEYVLDKVKLLDQKFEFGDLNQGRIQQWLK